MKQRIFYMDFLRSFAILNVLLLHSITPYLTATYFGTSSWYVHLALNAFCRTAVPLFLMLSGALMLSSENTKNFKSFYKKRILRLLIPLVFWNIAYFVYQWQTHSIPFDFNLLLDAFINCGTEYHLWYVYTLLGLYCITPFLKILMDRLTEKQQLLLLFLMLLKPTILPFINIITGKYMYLFDPMFNGYISFYLTGYMLSKATITRKKAILFAAFGVTGFVLSICGNHLHSSADSVNLIFNYGYSFCHYLLAVAVFAGVRFFFGKHRPFFQKGFSCLSKYSFGIYLVHVMVMDIITKHFMIDAAPVPSALYLFGTSFIVSFCIVFVLSKIKYINKIIL